MSIKIARYDCSLDPYGMLSREELWNRENESGIARLIVKKIAETLDNNNQTAVVGYCVSGGSANAGAIKIRTLPDYVNNRDFIEQEENICCYEDKDERYKDIFILYTGARVL